MPLDPEAFFSFTVDHRIGSFEGVPGLRGYLLGVAATLSMITKDLSRSVQGSGRVVMPLLFPPINDIALMDSLYSISIFVDLYEINCPPVFTKGRQYSESVERLATALEQQKSKCSLYFLFLASSSALAWIAVTLFMPSF